MKFLTSILCVMLLLAGCASPATRQWLDQGTAATITAQAEPIVFSREDFPAGVNVRDYVELGLFDVNRSGAHRRYVALVLWSTVDRSPQQLADEDTAFASVTLWADDQPLALKQISSAAQRSLATDSVLSLPSPNARIICYELNQSQLAALEAATRLSLSTANEAAGERPFTLWRGSLSSIRTFAAALTH